MEYFMTQPEEVSVAVVCGMKQRTVRTEITAMDDGGYRYEEIALPPGVWDYGSLVAAMVRLRYSDDEMTAVISNHLLDPANAETEAEWEAMQAWRAQAKATARRLLAEYP